MNAPLRSYDALVDALVARKDELGLSNGLCDELLGYPCGTVDKYLGPSRVKSIGPTTFALFCELLAVQFRLETDPAALKRMGKRWESRNGSAVKGAESRPIGKKLMGKLRTQVFREMGKKRMEIAAAAKNAAAIGRLGGLAKGQAYRLRRAAAE